MGVADHFFSLLFRGLEIDLQAVPALLVLRIYVGRLCVFAKLEDVGGLEHKCQVGFRWLLQKKKK